MATFTNYATLSYSGGRTDSNTVTGEIVETLGVTKTAVSENYSDGEDVTYVITLTNSGTAPYTGLTVADNLGGFSFNNATVYPLSYKTGSIRYYINGVLQTAPTVTAGPPLSVTGISVPAGGNVMLVYEANVTRYAPLAVESSITNTVRVLRGSASVLTASETIGTVSRARLSISKALCPTTVTESGRITYTFVIENSGNTPATVSDSVVLSDTFNPVLNSITVTYNGKPWVQTTNYTYNTSTGLFSTVAGQITVPAATFTQNSDGTWKTTPGTSTVVITGTV